MSNFSEQSQIVEKNWKLLSETDPDIYNAIVGEQDREKKGIENGKMIILMLLLFLEK